MTQFNLVMTHFNLTGAKLDGVSAVFALDRPHVAS